MHKNFAPPGTTPAPAREAQPMSRRLAQWIAVDSRLGKSCLRNLGTYSDRQLRERLQALREATELREIAMLACHGRKTPDLALIEAGVLVRMDEAMHVEHALRSRAASRDARKQWDDEGRPVPTTVDQPPLREAALCLQSTEELLRRLGDLRRAVSARRVAPDTTGRPPSAGAPSGERPRAGAANYEQQANTIAGILRKRGIAVR